MIDNMAKNSATVVLLKAVAQAKDVPVAFLSTISGIF